MLPQVGQHIHVQLEIHAGTRAPKPQRTKAVDDQGVMAFEPMQGIRNVYFLRNVEAVLTLAGKTVGLIESMLSAYTCSSSGCARWLAARVKLLVASFMQPAAV